MDSTTNLHTQLPYELCYGVVAWATFLEIVEDKTLAHHFFPWINADSTGSMNIPWPDVREQLEYKLDHPGIVLVKEAMYYAWEIIPRDTRFYSRAEVGRLHRNACLLFDDGEGFMVLYQCIKEFGG